jgi:NADH-quinone oxidoreductase subunit L
MAQPEHEPAAAAAHGASDAHAVGHGGHARPHESPATMLIPLVALAVLSLVGGWIAETGFTAGLPPILANLFGAGGQPSAFDQFLEPSFVSQTAGEAAHAGLDLFTELTLTALSIGAAAAGVLVAALLYLAGVPNPATLARTFSAPYAWLRDKWYIDELYQALIAHPGARLAAFLASFDLGVIDGMVNGVARAARGTGGALRQLQSGYVRGYAVTMLIGAFFILAYWAFR